MRVRSGPVSLAGDLAIPAGADGLVIFAHAGGSSRRSRRDVALAAMLREHGLATLLFDMLTGHEADVDLTNPQFRFDHSLLAGRVVDAIEWIQSFGAAAPERLGLFGSSTGAAAAFIAAARRPERIGAVVSRGGRTDLADQLLGQVHAPTLLIVGGDDTDVLEHNRRAHDQLAAQVKQLAVVDGAGHLFEESGALLAVGRLAGDWFRRHLSSPAGGGRATD